MRRASAARPLLSEFTTIFTAPCRQSSTDFDRWLRSLRKASEDRVVVNYIGRLVNGKVFDSSYARGEPLNIPVNRVIPGWTEALQLMSVGSKWQLVIPSKLGYGANGAGDLIPPHSTLIFDVELVSIDN